MMGGRDGITGSNRKKKSNGTANVQTVCTAAMVIHTMMPFDQSALEIKTAA